MKLLYPQKELPLWNKESNKIDMTLLKKQQ